MTPSRPAPASLSGATATPHAPEAPEKPARKSRWRRAIYAGGIAAVLVASVGIGRALWLKNQSAKLRTRTAEVAAFLRDGGPSGVASAEAGLRALAAVDAKGRTVAIETTHVRMMALIDVDPTQVQALSDAITAARTAGARPSDLAPAELIRAALLGDGSVTAEMLRQFDEDPGCAKNAFYQLAAGVALELSDAALAIERYRTVLSIEPDFFSAEARLVRLLALEGAVAEAKTRVVAFIGKKPGSNEAAALSLYMRAFEPGARPSAEDALDPANVHRPLRAVVRAASAKGDEKALATALSEADAAPIAVFCGEAALAAGHLATAREAGTRAIEMAPAYAPAYGLTARVALLTGRFEEARQSAQKATPEAQAEVMSLVAYESLDLLGLRDLAGARAAGPMSDPIAAAARRLAGQKPFEPAEIQSLAASGILWADIVAADAALDRGDLALARSIVERWPAPEKHPVRSLRLGRLLRYEGKFEAARSALKSATATLPARIEQALVAAELPAVRASIGAQMAGSARPEERWAGAYLLARENKPVPARLAFKGLPWPDGSTPLLTRILTMLALAELRSVPANAPFVPTLAPWGTNPDLARATAPKTAAPAHDGAPGGGGEDPY